MTKGIVAFAGNVTLEKVIWDNVWGQYIFLKLAQQKSEIKTANPFKKFTKMRKGKVGTRFGAVFSLSSGDIFYNDEVMLKNWSDGSSGWGLHLWVSPDKDGFHPFMDQSSTDKPEFGLAMVELDDDNTAIDQDKRERAEKAPKTRRQRTLSNYAAQLCRQPEFWEYIKSRNPTVHTEWDAGTAATWIRSRLGIDSRAQLDDDRFVADQFHADIRRPYSKWYSLRKS
jgi:hypothetical protein